MKFRTTLILLILVIGLGCFFLFHTARQPSGSEYKAQKDRLFAAREFEDPRSPNRQGISDLATKIELRDGESKILLERPETGAKREWRIVKPVSALADAGMVSSILSEMEFLRSTRALKAEKDKPLDLKSFGLEKPNRSVSFGFGNKTWTLNIGDKTADGKSVYVARADAAAPVADVVPESILQKVSEKVNDLRDKAAIRFEKSAVTRVDLAPAAKPTIELRKGPSGWRLAKPVNDAANDDAVTKLLDAASGARIEAGDFIADEDSRAAEFGLDKPSLKLAVFEGDSSRTLLIGSEVKGQAQKLYAKREGDPTIFALGKKDVEGLEKSLADLRLKTALQFNVDDVTAVGVTLPDKTLKLAKSGSTWKMESPPGIAIDGDQVQLFLNDLHNLDVKDWIDDASAERAAQAGLAPPQSIVTLTTKAGTGASAIQFGKATEKPEIYYARRGDAGPILLIPADIVTKVATGHLAFVSRKMMAFRKDDAIAVRLARPDGAVALEKQGDKWMVTQPAKAEADMAKVDDLLWGLSYLEAKQVVAEKPASLDPYGLGAPRIKAVMSIKVEETKPAEAKEGKAPAAPKPPEQKVLLVGNELADGASYATMEGGDRVFTIGKSIVDSLTADFVKKPEPKPETKPETKPEIKPEARPEGAK